MSETLEIWKKKAERQLLSGQITETLAGCPRADSWEHEDLAALENLLLNSYTSAAEVPDSLAEEIHMYIGNGLKKKYDGSWIDLCEAGIASSDITNRFGISYPALEHIDVCASMVELPFIMKTGRYWISLFETNSELTHKSSS